MRKITRQEALKALTLPALAAAISGTMVATAEAKASKATVKYQNSPKGTQKCSGCKFFVAGKSKTAAGSCQIVAGTISPNGWCTAFTKK
jgi:High potential iron-sulfur protein